MVPSMVWLTFLTWFTTNSLLLAVCFLWLGSGYKKDRSLSEPGGATPDFDRSVSPISTRGKFFTYVTKTRAHLSTYSRKPWNYNDTIIIEIDIMKKSSPLNLKFTFFAAVKTKITLLFSVTLTLCSAELQLTQ